MTEKAIQDSNCIIVGASHAGVSLALQLRKEGWQGGIQLIGGESELPYHRPPLSKEFLAGIKTLDQIRLRPEKLYQDNAIELMLGKSVMQLEPSARSIVLQDGSALQYDKLALCTGSLVCKLPVASELANVFYVRTSGDVQALSETVMPGKRAVIIGAGYIGLEAAAVLSQLGLNVTVLELADRILARVTGEQMSAYMTALHAGYGVSIRTATQVNDIVGSGKVEAVICGDGSKIAADLVIVGIGILPNVGLAQDAGLKVDGGIVVDEFARTSDEHIYAAGDCTSHPSALYGRRLRLESVQNANDQARIAAANICGKQQVYDAVPWFWSDQYKTKLQTVGVMTNCDEVIVRGDVTDSVGTGFALFYLLDGVLLAADCVNRPKEFMVAKQLVKGRARINQALLADEQLEPASWLQQIGA